MAVESPTRTDATGVARKIEQDIAAESSTTGEALNRFNQAANGESLGAATEAHLAELKAEERLKVFGVLKKDAAAGEEVFGKGGRSARINKALDKTTTKGRAHLSAGEKSVEYRTDMVVGLSESERKGDAENTNAHELHHANHQKAMQTVYTPARAVEGGDLNELASENAGSEKQFGDHKKLRKDAPMEYQRAHSAGDEFEALGVGRQQYESRIATGDSVGLQQDLIEGGLRTGQLTEEEVVETAQKIGDPIYGRAASQVLQNREDKPESKSPLTRLEPSLN